MKRVFRLLVIIVVAASSLTACRAVRKKNRCNTCPKWEDNVQWNQPSAREAQY